MAFSSPAPTFCIESTTEYFPSLPSYGRHMSVQIPRKSPDFLCSKGAIAPRRSRCGRPGQLGGLGDAFSGARRGGVRLGGNTFVPALLPLVKPSYIAAPICPLSAIWWARRTPAAAAHRLIRWSFFHLQLGLLAEELRSQLQIIRVVVRPHFAKTALVSRTSGETGRGFRVTRRQLSRPGCHAGG